MAKIQYAIHMYVCMYVCKRMKTIITSHVYTHTCTDPYIHAYSWFILATSHVYKRTCICKYIYIHIHVYKRTYICMYT